MSKILVSTWTIRRGALQKISSTGAKWTIASATGTLLGATAAKELFPDVATFGRVNDMTMWQLAAFAWVIGVFLGLGQSIVIARKLSALPASKLLVAVIWSLVSALGVVLMVLPMYWMPDQWAYLFLVAPYAGFLPMLPGLVLLALAQKLVIKLVFSKETKWLRQTLSGGSIGLILGSLAALSAASATSFEIVVATSFGATMGLFQRRDVSRFL